MAITTLDGVVAGYQIPVVIDKSGITMGAVSAGRFHSHWMAAGQPFSGATPASGINGGSLTSPVTGQFVLPSTSTSTYTQYLARVELQSSVAASFILADRLWQNSGVSMTGTGVQSLSFTGLPARDANGSTLGVGCMAGLEFSAAGGVGTPTVTLVYDDQNGVTSTAQFVGVASPPQGSFWIWPVTGIRTVRSVQLSATWTSGNSHIVLFRPLAYVGAPTAYLVEQRDVVTLGMPVVYSGAVPYLIQIPTATTATRITGRLVTTQG
jgi:hypothetical protein